MENRIRQHIESLFARGPQTPRAHELKEEMILNVIERYHDLVNGGMAEEEAYRAAISGIGDVSELIAGLYQDPAAQSAAPGGQSAQSAQSVGNVPGYAPPAGQEQPRKKHSTAAIVAAIICGTILLLVLISCIAGANIIRSLFSKGGFLNNVVDSAMGELGSSSITWDNGGKVAIGGDDTGFDNAYSAENRYAVAASGVKNLKIEWVSGAVTVEPYDGTEIEFYETATSAIKEEDALRYRLNGDTLSIRFCKSTTWSGVNWGDLNINSIVPPKELTLRIPEALLNEGLAQLEIDSVSNSVTVTDIPVDTCKVNTVSGNVFLWNMAMGSLTADTVSGGVSLDGCAVGSGRFNSVSGNVELSGAFGSVKYDSVSGGLSFMGSLGELEADTISGTVRLTLPADPGFTLEYDTVSGRFQQNGATTSGGKDHSLVIGDGKAEYEVETVSGDLSVDIQ